MQRTTGKQLQEASASFKLGPPKGQNFFVHYGPGPMDLHGNVGRAGENFSRRPKELLALLPEPKGLPGNYPWTEFACSRSS
jgi:hypothetical protein